MWNNAWVRCMACYTLGCTVVAVHDTWIWLPLMIVGIVVLAPMKSKIVPG